MNINKLAFGLSSFILLSQVSVPGISASYTAMSSSTVGLDFKIKNTSNSPVKVTVISTEALPRPSSRTFNPSTIYTLNPADSVNFEHEEYFYWEYNTYEKKMELKITYSFPSGDIERVCKYSPTMSVRYNSFLQINPGVNQDNENACDLLVKRENGKQFLEFNILVPTTKLGEIKSKCVETSEIGLNSPIRDSICPKGSIVLNIGNSKAYTVIEFIVQKPRGTSSESAHFNIRSSGTFNNFPPVQTSCNYDNGTCIVSIFAQKSVIYTGAQGKITVTNTGGEDFQVGNVTVEKP